MQNLGYHSCQIVQNVTLVLKLIVSFTLSNMHIVLNCFLPICSIQR
jgi:hypothetical protein